MKREAQILNGVCLLLALAFLAFAVYNALLAGSVSAFLTIDNLFITAFCLVMAAIFIVIPAYWMITTGVVRLPFLNYSNRETEPEVRTVIMPAAASSRAPAAIGPASAAAAPSTVRTSAGSAAALPASREVQRDAKGRPVPADVQRMLAEMKKAEQQ